MHVGSDSYIADEHVLNDHLIGYVVLLILVINNLTSIDSGVN